MGGEGQGQAWNAKENDREKTTFGADLIEGMKLVVGASARENAAGSILARL